MVEESDQAYLYYFPGAVVTEYHKLGDSHNKTIVSRSGDERPKIMMSTVLVPSVGCEGESVSFIFRSF